MANLTSEDHAFMAAVIAQHPDSARKMGAGIQALTVE